jgi:hypothetical protein
MMEPTVICSKFVQQRNWGRNLHLIRSATPIFAVHSFSSKYALAQTQVFSVLLAFLSLVIAGPIASAGADINALSGRIFVV